MNYKFQDKTFKWIVKYNSQSEVNEIKNSLIKVSSKTKNNENIKAIQNILSILKKSGIEYQTILMYKNTNLMIENRNNLLKNVEKYVLMSINPSEIHCKIMKSKQIMNAWEGSRDVQSYKNKPFIFKIPNNIVLITHIFNDLLTTKYSDTINRKIKTVSTNEVRDVGLNILSNITQLFPSEKNKMVVGLPNTICINYKLKIGRIKEKSKYINHSNNIDISEFIKNKNDTKMYFLNDFLNELSSIYPDKILFIFLTNPKKTIIGKKDEPSFRLSTFKYHIDMLNMHAYETFKSSAENTPKTTSIMTSSEYKQIDSDKLYQKLFKVLNEKVGGKRKSVKKYSRKRKNITLKKRLRKKLSIL